jgi:hypothetical protein
VVLQNPYQPNDYVRVLTAIGGIISYYDTDKLFPAFGFGGLLKSQVVSHDFPLVSATASIFLPHLFLIV